jgi:uncharacterized protein YcbX
MMRTWLSQRASHSRLWLSKPHSLSTEVISIRMPDGYVGRMLHIGSKVVVSVLERGPRCRMITLDPDTAQPNAQPLRTATQTHDNRAGVYGAVLVEGIIRRGDVIGLA